MKKCGFGVGLVACVIAAALLAAGASGGAGSVDRAPTFASTTAEAAFVPGELIVRFAPTLGKAARASILRDEGARLDEELLLPGAVVVRLPEGESVAAAAEAFERRAGVRYAEPNWIHRIAATPNDPRFGELWGLNQGNDADIDAPQAWDVTKGSSTVVVAPVDSGVAYGHPDLSPNIWTNPGEIDGDGIDNDGNGFIDDIRGWDFIQNDKTPLDYNGHGTHVAGTIGAQGNNGLGVTGVNWDVSLMPLRAGTPDGSLPTAAIVNSFNYACAEGADVVNGSFGASVMSTAIRDAVLACPNMLFVFAAGNDAKDLDGSGSANDAFPCELHRAPTSAANVLCVAATDQDDMLASFSNHGSDAVHLAAPGVDILSTWPAYQTIAGTPDGFEGTLAEFDARWGDRTSTAGDMLWGRTELVKKSGTYSLTDSPGAGVNYANSSDTTIRKLSSFSLAGQSGCRIDYEMRLATEFGFDPFNIYAGTTTTTPTFVAGWWGSTAGQFFDFSSNLSMFDGQPTTYVRFRLFSDGSITDDGVYLDDILVKCLHPGGADYLSIDGTSMASPHVAGVAALLLAQDPTRTVSELKTLLTSSVDVLASLDDKAITEGRLNACKALGRTDLECDQLPPEALLAIGAPGESLGTVGGAGTTNVLYGGPLSATGNQFWTQNSAGVLEAAESGDNLGSTLATGDFNNDGVPDLAMGVPGEDLGAFADAGAINVLYGSAGVLTAVGNQFWTQNSPGVLEAAESGDRFGGSFVVGDFDGDGYDDLAVGVPGESLGPATQAGAVNVLYGSATGLAAAGNQFWTQNSTGVLETAESGDFFGTALAAGDFDDDGDADLAVGVGEDLGAFTDAGAVQVLRGSSPSGLTATGNQFWTQNSPGVLDAVETGDEFGQALAAGDFDADGDSDLAVGVREDLGAFTDAGLVQVLHGSSPSGLTATGNQFWTQNSPGVLEAVETGDRFGWALAAGDFDDDGQSDLAVGVPFESLGSFSNAGAVNVLYGSSPSGLTATGNQFWTQNSPSVLEAAETDDNFGRALAAGDLSGDGYAELAIGVPGEDLGSVVLGAGAVNVLYSGASGLGAVGNQFWTQNSPGVLDAAESGDAFGSALASSP